MRQAEFFGAIEHRNHHVDASLEQQIVEFSPIVTVLVMAAASLWQLRNRPFGFSALECLLWSTAPLVWHPPKGHKPCAAKIHGEEMKGEFGGKLFRLSKTVRKSPTLGQKPPPGALVLFDGTSKSEWSRGMINEKFATLMPKGDLVTRRQFNNYSIHLELMLPYQPDYRSQDRGNSGFYQVHDYEIQILDSFAMDGAHNECGGIYSHKGSDLNMCLPPLVWQTFDVEFTNAVAKNRKKTKNAIITVRHNGVLIHDEFEIPGKSKYGARGSPEGTPGPIKLQDHREPLQFRNVWIVPHGPTPPPPTSNVAEAKPKPAPKPTPPTSEAAKGMLGEWNVRFVNNGSAYVLNLKKDGSSHLARKGKAWNGVWIVENSSLTITNPHDVIRIQLVPKDDVYTGKNNWGAARLSRKELPRF